MRWNRGLLINSNWNSSRSSYHFFVPHHCLSSFAFKRHRYFLFFFDDWISHTCGPNIYDPRFAKQLSSNIHRILSGPHSPFCLSSNFLFFEGTASQRPVFHFSLIKPPVRISVHLPSPVPENCPHSQLLRREGVLFLCHSIRAFYVCIRTMYMYYHLQPIFTTMSHRFWQSDMIRFLIGSLSLSAFPPSRIKLDIFTFGF